MNDIHVTTHLEWQYVFSLRYMRISLMLQASFILNQIKPYICVTNPFPGSEEEFNKYTLSQLLAIWQKNSCHYFLWPRTQFRFYHNAFIVYYL